MKNKTISQWATLAKQSLAGKGWHDPLGDNSSHYHSMRWVKWKTHRVQHDMLQSSVQTQPPLSSKEVRDADATFVQRRKTLNWRRVGVASQHTVGLCYCSGNVSEENQSFEKLCGWGETRAQTGPVLSCRPQRLILSCRGGPSPLPASASVV